MQRRDLLKYAGATALAAPFIRSARADTGTIKIGVVGPKTGPLAPGAAVTHFPAWRLWAHQVNEAGGIKLKGGPRKVELIEYDDRTQPAEAIKAVAEGRYAGKVVIFPQITHLPLTGLNELKERLPNVAAKLGDDLMWTNEAEAALIDECWKNS